MSDADVTEIAAQTMMVAAKVAAPSCDRPAGRLR